MDEKELEGLSLPKPEEARPPRRRGVHFMMETEDGEGLSVWEDELSEYLKKYGQKPRTGDTDSSQDSGSRP